MEYTKGEWRTYAWQGQWRIETSTGENIAFNIPLEANACLMASAPKLYEALKVVKDALENNQNNGREALQLAIKASLFITNKALAEVEGK